MGTYYVPEARGRESLLTDEEARKLLLAIDTLRNLKKSVDSSLVQAIAKGIVTRSRPIVVNEGAIRISKTWAISWMKSNGQKPLARTTTRCVDPAKVINDGAAFFAPQEAALRQ